MIAKKKDFNYPSFLAEIKEHIYRSRLEALKSVNRELIDLYWNIGRKISEEQTKHGWGKSVVTALAADLQSEFPGTLGFSASNLWRIRSFFIEYNGNEKLAPLVREISWTKNIAIMEKCKNDGEKEFYIKMTRKFGWTKAVLLNHIENRSFEKFLLNQTNFNRTVPEKYRRQAKLAVKDEYMFDFLEIGEEHSEKELEAGLVNNIRKFLIEMGGYFTFVGNQYRLEVDDEEYFIDLLLYHRKLKCLVAIELKSGDFKPEYAGKMQFYLSLLNDRVKLEDENPSIGIIVCKNKKRAIVEYALRDSHKPMGVATYKISAVLPREYKKFLPSPEELSDSLLLLDEE